MSVLMLIVAFWGGFPLTLWLCNSLLYLQFLETGPELGSHYNEVIAPQDVATYGGLCALATFDRSELKAHILCFFFLLITFPMERKASDLLIFLTNCFNLAVQSYRQCQLSKFLRVGSRSSRADQWFLLKVCGVYTNKQLSLIFVKTFSISSLSYISLHETIISWT